MSLCSTHINNPYPPDIEQCAPEESVIYNFRVLEISTALPLHPLSQRTTYDL
ncbi:hypothetical protein M413DRAFT_448565 [Hebeloma cylindrosporum]|uniref:Uncharacterized protein n=1 Tax=Hebeloma cylindrosporum TaxID=76867 RepID=A0A0C2Y8B7_HEBCY|nr:hypothetical protein M413DRAFT_448565 [Hebeloma cylindrosporum h7]